MAKKMSPIRDSTASTEPPKNPEMMPQAEPKTRVNKVARIPTSIEDRAP